MQEHRLSACARHGALCGAEPESPEERLAVLLRGCGRYLYHNGPERAGQLRILCILAERGPMSQRALQELLGVQPGSLSEILGKLESAGKVTRTQNPNDRRAMDLTVTGQGAEDAREMRRRHDAFLCELFSVLTPDEREQLHALLFKLLDAWYDGHEHSEK